MKFTTIAAVSTAVAAKNSFFEDLFARPVCPNMDQSLNMPMYTFVRRAAYNVVNSWSKGVYGDKRPHLVDE